MREPLSLSRNSSNSSSPAAGERFVGPGRVGLVETEIGALSGSTDVERECHIPLGAGEELVDPFRVPLLMQMPWFTDIVTSGRDRLSMLPRDLHAMATSLLTQFRETHNRAPCRDIIMNQATLTPNQKSAGSLVSILFGLRFLDVASIVNGLETRGCEDPLDLAFERPSIPRTVFEGQTGKLRGIASLCENQGWPRVLSDIHTHMLSSGPVADPTLHPDEMAGSSKRQLLITAFRQLDSISQRDTNLMLVKALHNMESTAFFINYMLQGHFDFPHLWKTLVNELKSAANTEGVPCQIASNLPPITRLRQPLFLALAVSPLILLCDITPMSTNLTRLHMLRAWYHYGNDRPAVLRKVEGMLWRELFRMARGEVTSAVALQTFMGHALPLVSLARSEQDFFNPRHGIPATMPVGLSYVSTESPLDPLDRTSPLQQHARIEELVSNESYVSGEDTDEDILSTGSSMEGALLLSSAINVGSSLDCDTFRQWALPVVDSRDMFGTEGFYQDSVVSNASLQRALGGGDMDVSSILTLGHVLSASTGVHIGTAGFPDFQTIGPASVTPSNLWSGSASSVSVAQVPEDNEPSHPEPPAEPVLVHAPGSCNKGLDAVDVLGKPANSKAKKKGAVFRRAKGNRIVFEDWREHLVGDGYILVSPMGVQTAYWPRSYHTRELALISQLLSRSNSYQHLSGNQSLFLKVTLSFDKALSDEELLRSAGGSPVQGLCVLDRSEYCKLDLENGLSLLLDSKIILMRSSTGNVSVTRELLNEIGSCSTVRECIDLSFRWTDPAVKDVPASASFLDLLAQIERGRKGYSFYFPAIPRRNEKYTTPSLSTNVFSHRYTAGFPGYEISEDTSPSRSNWHFVAPANVLHHGDVSPNGFNTEIHVEAGVVLAFFGQCEDALFLAHHDSFTSSRAELHDFSRVQGVLVFAGEKIVFGPGVPYYLLTVEPSICHGSHFYTTATMERSYWSVIHHFLAADFNNSSFVDQDHDMICRIVLHWHDAIVRFPTEYLRGCREQRGIVHHVPNILSVDGVIQLFSLSAFVLIAGVFTRERRASDSEWRRLHDLYSRCRSAFQEIFSTLDVNVAFWKGDRRSLFGVADLWNFYIIQQCGAFLALVGKLRHGESLLEAVKASFRLDLGDEDGVLEAVDSILEGSKFVFDKNTEWSLTLEDCSSFAWCLVDDLKSGYTMKVAPEALKRGLCSSEVRCGYVLSGQGGVKRRRVLANKNVSSPVRIIKT
ncbi:hypothetical protein VNI00_017673 [Paramarasmius palmivorus]|uniref:Uncharacterized protein n=1 Tax=Paramarasmius palmivorus TaxID=297713 RepID=A0AAW0B7G0_9AGAR